MYYNRVETDCLNNENLPLYYRERKRSGMWARIAKYPQKLNNKMKPELGIGGRDDHFGKSN